MWEGPCQLPRWDVGTAASVTNQRADIREQVIERFLPESKLSPGEESDGVSLIPCDG